MVSGRGCLLGLPGVAALAGRVSLPEVRGPGWVAVEQRPVGVCGLRASGVGYGGDDLPPDADAAAVVVRGGVG